MASYDIEDGIEVDEVRTAELTPSLEKLNSATPMPLLGVAGVTDADRREARRARLKIWTQGRDDFGATDALDWALKKEPSVAFFGECYRDEVGRLANSSIQGLSMGARRPSDWNWVLGGGYDSDIPYLTWAEPPVRAIVREDFGESGLAEVADFFEEREATIAAAYRDASKQPLLIETPWDRWDVRRNCFDHAVMLAACSGRPLPAISGSREAFRLCGELGRLFPEASPANLCEVLLHVTRLGVGQFRDLNENVREVPGIGFEISVGPDERFVAASPGRVEARAEKSGGAIELLFPDGGPTVAFEQPEKITARTLFQKLASAGVPVSFELITDCLRCGLWDRVRTAAAVGVLP